MTSYIATAWKDGADGGTAITAARLNNIEQGVKEAHDGIVPVSRGGTGANSAKGALVALGIDGGSADGSVAGVSGTWMWSKVGGLGNVLLVTFNASGDSASVSCTDKLVDGSFSSAELTATIPDACPAKYWLANVVTLRSVTMSARQIGNAGKVMKFKVIGHNGSGSYSILPMIIGICVN